MCDLIVIRYKLIQKKKQKKWIILFTNFNTYKFNYFFKPKKNKTNYIYYNNGIFALNNIKKINT